MAISGKQIKAARALADLRQDELAELVGLTPQAIRKIEDDAVQPREGTMKDMVDVFTSRGVEFIENSGVRLKPQGIEVLVGQLGLQHFFDGVYEYTRKNGGTILQLGIEEDLFWAMGVEFSEQHRKRMADLVQERNDIKVYAILCEGDTNFIASDYNQYRWIAKKLFSPVPFYIYGEYLAIMNFQTTPKPTIILHKFPAITEAYRKQFDAFWQMSREPDVPQNTKKVTDRNRKK